jgi:hypothetical protein
MELNLFMDLRRLFKTQVMGIKNLCTAIGGMEQLHLNTYSFCFPGKVATWFIELRRLPTVPAYFRRGPKAIHLSFSF